MKNKVISSYNSRLRNTSKQVLIPTGSQIVFDLILGAFLLLVVNARLIWLYFDQNIFSLRGIAFSTFGNNSGVFSHVLAVITNTRLPQVVFWVFIGAAAYVFIWLSGNVLSNLHNDIAADGYMHPKSYSHVGYWSSVLTRKVIFALMSLVFIGFLYACLKVLPVLGHLSYASAMDLSSTHNALTLGTSLAAAALIVHVLVLLISMVLNSWKFIYKDL